MCHVLIIEDEPLVAGYLGELALKGGASSLSFAETEQAAISAACTQRPALIFSDVKLAEGTGPSAIREIATRLGPIPVIFITGSPDLCEVGEQVAAVLLKPVNSTALLAAFRQARS